MVAFEDLTGQVFGMLTVLKLDITKNRRTHWIVKCSCGKTKPFSVMSYNLKNGNTRSCNKEHRINDLTGKRFGALIVLKFDFIDGERTYWKCRCTKCEKIVSIRSDTLQRNIKSCGCQTESIIATSVKKYCINKFKNCICEYRVCKNPKTNRWLRCDIYIPEIINNKNGIYIEIHGKQHYKLGTWHYRLSKEKGTTPEEEFEDQKYRDKIKRKYARKNGTYIEINLIKIDNLKDAILYIEEKLYHK